MSTLVAGYPVDERGVWHHNGPPFFLEVRHLSLDSAFQTLLHKQKATQCVNLSLIQQYKDKDSQHKDDDSSKKLCLHLSRVPMSSAWNQTLFVGCYYLNCPVAEMHLTPNTSNPMIRNEISQRTFCDPLCRVKLLFLKCSWREFTWNVTYFPPRISVKVSPGQKRKEPAKPMIFIHENAVKIPWKKN